ncbi:MAG: hypothetical protein IID44_26100 [Planctomycetes bacterium]|nr:hypothetical protein [Planctomycetota bacterium]
MAIANDQSEPLGIENAMDLLIVLLYTPGTREQHAEPIDGITRIQKLMFLLSQGVGPRQLVREAESCGFVSYKMGPYAPQIIRDLEDLLSAGIVASKRLEYLLPDDGDNRDLAPHDWERTRTKTKRVESLRYSLTADLGMNVGKELWKSLSSRERDDLARFKSFFNSLSLRQLLIFTYERYPDWTTESTIKEQLGLT